MSPRDRNGRLVSGVDSKPRVIQFGAFELRTDTGELRKHGIRVRLQMKPFQVLLALIEHPGEVVRREQLQQRLWPADTFVDFESGLNTAANRLRIALGDSAEVPRFIETLPRIGYRFIAPVREVALPVAVTPPPEPAFEAPVASEAPVPDVVAEPAQAIPAPTVPPAPMPDQGKRYGVLLGIGCGLAIVVATLLLSGHFVTRAQNNRSAQFHEIPFSHGSLSSARFGPDGESILYTISGNGQSQTYMGHTISPESSSVSIQGASVVSVSRHGELALIKQRDTTSDGPSLLQANLQGGAPRETAKSIFTADWAPNSDSLAVVRSTGGRFSIEYPLGNPIYQPSRWASDLRVSPDGNRIAFIEHPFITDDAGQVRVIDLQGRTRVLSQTWASAEGLAWAPSGAEVWFTASKSGTARALHAITLDGVTRLVATVPGALRLLDISRTGRVLISRDDERMLMTGKLAADSGPEDLSLYDFSHADAISADGNLLLFTECGEVGGANYSMYIHNRSANTTTRIGKAQGLAISPDQKSVLSIDVKDPGSLTITELAGRQHETISGAGLRYQWATFFPDGRRLLAGGSYPGQPLRLYTQSVDGGAPVPLNTSTYLDFAIISPDAKQVAGYALGRKLVILSLDTFVQRDVPQGANLYPVSWSADGRGLLLSTISGPVMNLFRLDTVTGRRELQDTFSLPDTGAGVHAAAIVATPSGKYWACSYTHTVSQLYVVDGWC